MKYLTGNKICAAAHRALCENPNGTVHSVFENAVNISFGGQIVCITAKAGGLNVYGISACPLEQTNENISFLDFGIGAGGAAVFNKENQTLAVFNKTKKNGAPLLAVNLEKAEAINLKLGEAVPYESPADDVYRKKCVCLQSMVLNAANLQDGLGALAYALGGSDWRSAEKPNQERQSGKTGKEPEIPLNHWCTFILPRMRRLPTVMLQGGEAEAAKAGAALAGCGPGLTPSSDDFLTGFIAAALALHRAGVYNAPNAKRACKALANAAAEKTGDISAMYLKAAGDGLFGQSILNLLASFFSVQDEEKLEKAAAEVIDFGSSSGTDILAGVWFALHSLAA